ncbi:MAG: molybdopterin-dependent oxidoreductase [Solirubrobacteraceae bacterium]
MESSFRTCPLCEATCGLEIRSEGDRVESVRGDAGDVFSHGYICPKGVSLKQLHEDPDRLRTPLLRNAQGGFDEVSWERAFAVVAERLPPIIERDGRDAVAVYLGNPNAHLLSNLIYSRVLLKTLGSRNVFSASTVDQFPKQMAAAYMFGTGATVPVPDLDRTEYLLMLGANPLASNGSLMTAPDARGRLLAIQARGGRIVVIDPRRSRTAELADEHHFIRPGTDALLLFALVFVLFDEGLAEPAAGLVSGLDVVRSLSARFPPEDVAAACGIEAAEIRRIARELVGASSAAVYGRIGTCTQEFGSLSSWLVDVLNFVSGNLDRPGGAMFPRAAAGAANTHGEPGSGRGARFGRFTSRVRGLGELFGELPVAALAEEIDTPGAGQVRALICVAGNPALSTPNSARLTRALEGLEFIVSLDVYVNETSRLADVILPGPSPLERSHYDLALYQFAIRNVANYSPALFEAPAGMPQEWETLLRLAAIVAGQGPEADVDGLDDLVAGELARRECAAACGPLAGLDPSEVLREVDERRGPERILDLMLRAGPYELTLAELEAAPHGIDLGALEPRLPEVLRTPSGRIELAPEPLVADVPRLEGALRREHEREQGAMVLIGRRHLRSNNSWLHNLPLLAGGPDRCTALVNPADAERLELVDGELARVRSRTGEIELPVEVTASIMPGVVSIPHGWGHDTIGSSLSVAVGHPGANSNLLADEDFLDGPSGNAVLNGIPVELAPAGVLA